MQKKRVALITVASVAVIALVVFAITTIGPFSKHHDPYSQNFSALETAADFSIGGEKQYFDKLKPGEENILLFWGSWCPHCESLIEKIDQTEDKETIKKNLFTVAVDDNLDGIEIHRGDFPIYLDQDKGVYHLFKLEHVPSVFILNDQGKVIGSSQGEQDSLKLLEEYAAYNK